MKTFKIITFNWIFSLFFVLFFFPCQFVFSEEESVTVTAYYPAPFGDYEKVRVNSYENYEVISNVSPSIANPSDVSDFRFVNVNRGACIYGDIAGDDNSTYIQADAASQDLLVRGKMAQDVTVTLDQRNSLANGNFLVGVKINRAGSEKMFFGLDTDAEEKLYFRRNGSENALVIDNVGNVGLGTDNPSSILHVQNSNNFKMTIEKTNRSTAVISADNSGVGLQTDKDLISFKTGVVPFGDWATTGNERLIISSDKKMGIGTNNLERALNLEAEEANIILNDTGTSSYNTLIWQNGGSSTWALGKMASNDFYIPRNNRGWQDDTFFIDYETGNVGFGIGNPTEKVDIDGAMLVRNPGTTPNGSEISLSTPAGHVGSVIKRGNGSGGVVQRWDMQVNRSSDDFQIIDNTHKYGDRNPMLDTTLAIKGGSQNVGIGTSNPSAKLEVVNGKILISDKSWDSRLGQKVIELDADNPAGPRMSFGVAGDPDKFMIISADRGGENKNRIDCKGRTLKVTGEFGAGAGEKPLYMEQIRFDNRGVNHRSKMSRFDCLPVVAFHKGCGKVVVYLSGNKWCFRTEQVSSAGGLFIIMYIKKGSYRNASDFPLRY